jgi:hypothetical protein
MKSVFLAGHQGVGITTLVHFFNGENFQLIEDDAERRMEILENVNQGGNFLHNPDNNLYRKSLS